MSGDQLDRWREAVQRNDQLKEENMTITETKTAIAHPSWCVPEECSVKWREDTLFGEHSEERVHVPAADDMTLTVGVTQFLGNFGSVAPPRVEVYYDCSPAAFLFPESADQLAAALTAAAVHLREIQASGDYIPIKWGPNEE